MCGHVWLCNPLDCSPPGSSVHGIFQARILEWVAICYSEGSFPLRDWNHVSCIGRQILYHCTNWEAPEGTAFWPYFPTGCLQTKVCSQQCGCWETLLHRSLVFQSALWLYLKFKPKMCLCQGHNCILMSNPENWRDVSLEKRTNLLAGYYKVVGSQGSMFSCNTNHCIFRHIFRPVILTWGWFCSSGALGNINNLRYTDDSTLMAESKEKLKNLLI